MGSFAQVPWALLQGGASAQAIALYAALHRFASWADGTGEASRAQLMAHAGIGSPTAYYAARRWLRDHGWVEVIDWHGRATRYLVHTRPTPPRLFGTEQAARAEPNGQPVRNRTGRSCGTERAARSQPNTTPEVQKVQRTPRGAGGVVEEVLERAGASLAHRLRTAPRWAALELELVALEAAGWAPDEVADRLLERSLNDAQSAAGVFAHRVEQLRDVVPPSVLRGRELEAREAANRAAWEQELDREEAAMVQELGQQALDAMSDVDREAALEAAEAAAREQGAVGPTGRPVAAVVRELARRGALEQKGLHGLRLRQAALDRLQARHITHDG